jgi:hypothetical protein
LLVGVGWWGVGGGGGWGGWGGVDCLTGNQICARSCAPGTIYLWSLHVVDGLMGQ